MRTSTALALLTGLAVATPIVSAAPLRSGPRPFPPPHIEGDEDSSHSGGSRSKPEKKPMALPPKAKPDGVKGYCKMIHAALQIGQSITPDSDSADKFNSSIDFLTKADALCGAIAPATESEDEPMGSYPHRGEKGRKSSSTSSAVSS